MPFFFILPAWLLCVIVGAMLCLFKRCRYLSLYLVLGSTGGASLSLAASTFVLWIGPKLLSDKNEWSGLILITAYLVSLAGAGFGGAVAGFLTAASINRRLRWTRVY